MMLSQLLNGYSEARVIRDCEINNIAYDSRQVQHGSVFVARSGFQLDGHDFIEQAVNNGAVAIISENTLESCPANGYAIVDDSRKVLSYISQRYYGNPSNHMFVVGITGTKGKTSVCHLVKSILDAAGHHTGLMGTVHNIIGDEIRPVTFTTPESLDIHNLHSQMLDKGCTAVTMEVSSHALTLNRVDHVMFDVAVLTNIGRDHLDFHSSFREYLDAKKKLFDLVELYGAGKIYPSFFVINSEDQYTDHFCRGVKLPVIKFGLTGNTEIGATDISLRRDGTDFTLAYGNTSRQVRIKLPGRFNVLNALAAAAVGYGLELDADIVAQALENTNPVKGRVETVPAAKGFSVWVDYAHTPESLESILKMAKELSCARVICVFGCGGNRDKSKRAIMGEIAARLADHVIITNDNPRTEDENQIINQIEEGVLQVHNPSYKIIPHRRAAIYNAIGLAGKNDIVIIAGKGHETYQMLNKGAVRFDDVEEATKAILDRRNTSEILT